MAQKKSKKSLVPLFIAFIISVGIYSGWQITKTTHLLPKKATSPNQKEPEQFTLIGACDYETCLFENGKVVLGMATLRGYYKTTQKELEDYTKGGSRGKVTINVKEEFIVVSKTLSRDAVPLIEYLAPESVNSTEDDVSIKISTTDLRKEDKKILIETAKDKLAEVKVHSRIPSGGGPFAGSPYIDLLSVK